MFLPLLRLYFPITGVSCSVFHVFTTFFSSYWTFVSRFSRFRDSIFQLMDFCVSFLLFSRLRFPVTGLSCLISPVFTTPFSSYWTFVSHFSPFPDTIFQLLDFCVSFLSFSRHCFPFNGLLCLVSLVFTTLFSSYWTFVSRFSPFHDIFLQLLDFRVSFIPFSRLYFPFIGLPYLLYPFFTILLSSCYSSALFASFILIG